MIFLYKDTFTNVKTISRVKIKVLILYRLEQMMVLALIFYIRLL